MSGEPTARRGFLVRLLGATAAAGLSFGGARSASAQTGSASGGPDAWIGEVRGTQRCLFDFPQHRNAVPLLHILNYLNTYKEAYNALGSAGAVGTFYGIGTLSSIPMAFNDAMWAKYQLGEYAGLKDASGKPYTRNVFYRLTGDDGHLLGEAMHIPAVPALAPLIPAMSIESLQKMGTKFLLCDNAFGAWCAELEARGKGKAMDLQNDLAANLLPGVTRVPAMVIAIQKAQRAGISYNRQ